MSAREEILNRLKNAQRKSISSTNRISFSRIAQQEQLEKDFVLRLTQVGGVVLFAESIDEITAYVEKKYEGGGGIINGLRNSANQNFHDSDLSSCQVAVLLGQFGIAENGAVWITDESMLDRALPFICENLVLAIDLQNLVSTMHDAYARIAAIDYAYGTFICGPSKTADIEQSLVLGAHGPRTLTVFLVGRRE